MKEDLMSFRQSHRLVVTALALASLLALAAPPAHAAGNLLDSLGAKVQGWAAAWWPWPAAASHGIVAANPDGGARANFGTVHGGRPGGNAGRQAGRALPPGVRPACDNAGIGDPNGCPR
jgi:hypothetical protein